MDAVKSAEFLNYDTFMQDKVVLKLEMDKEEKRGASETFGGLKRVVLTTNQRDAVGEQCAAQIDSLNAYVEHIEEKNASIEGELLSLKTSEEKLKTQLSEASHRERVLIRRLANKDQEMQELMAQLNELKAAQVPGMTSLRSAFLDPAVNMLISRLRQEVATLKTRLDETQSELSAWKFTPDSNTGKRLMAKCRLLYQENEELGRVVSSGRLAKLEGDLALQKRLSEEVKRSQSELDEILQDLDEDVEGMQGTILILQQELRKSKEESRVRHGGDDASCNDHERNEEQTLTNGNGSDGYDRTCSPRNSSPSHKRTQSDQNNSPSSSPVPVKKRRTSELSLDYNEDDELGITNGDLKLDDL